MQLVVYRLAVVGLLAALLFGASSVAAEQNTSPDGTPMDLAAATQADALSDVAQADPSSDVDTGDVVAPTDDVVTPTDDAPPAVQDQTTATSQPWVHARIVTLHTGRDGSSPNGQGWHLLPDPTMDASGARPGDSARALEGLNRTPSPVDAPLFSGVGMHLRCCGLERPSVAVEILWLVPGRIVTYQYTCATSATGECTGSAVDVWNAMPVEQRQAYLASLLVAGQIHPVWPPGVQMASQIDVVRGHAWWGIEVVADESRGLPKQLGGREDNTVERRLDCAWRLLDRVAYTVDPTPRFTSGGCPASPVRER